MSATFHENVVETLIKIGVIQRGAENWYLSSPARMLDIPAKYSIETRDAALDQMAIHWNIKGQRDGMAPAQRCEPPEGQREGDTHHWLINPNRVPDEVIGWWSGEAWQLPGDNGYYFPADLPYLKYGRPCTRVAKEPTAPEITMDTVRALVEQLPRGTIWKTQLNELIEYTKLALVRFVAPATVSEEWTDDEIDSTLEFVIDNRTYCVPTNTTKHEMWHIGRIGIRKIAQVILAGKKS